MQISDQLLNCELRQRGRHRFCSHTSPRPQLPPQQRPELGERRGDDARADVQRLELAGAAGGALATVDDAPPGAVGERELLWGGGGAGREWGMAPRHPGAGIPPPGGGSPLLGPKTCSIFFIETFCQNSKTCCIPPECCRPPVL